MDFDIKENTAINLVHEFLKYGHIQTEFLSDLQCVGTLKKQNAAMYFNNYVQYQPTLCETVESKKTDPAPLFEARQESALTLQK